MTIRSIAAALAASFLLSAGASANPASVLIWPVDPVIEANRQATALWLENPGSTPILLQVRIFAWAQFDGENAYAAQNEIVGTPPMVRIEPGKRQLVRLTRTVPPAPGKEYAYRIVVDEIPAAGTGGVEATSGASVRFRMRYSLPLFVYGEGLDHRKPKEDKAFPTLHWTMKETGGKRFLEVRNEGNLHARLVGVGFSGNGKTQSVAPGLLGYVLPGATVRWPVPETVVADGSLVADVNGIPGIHFKPAGQ